MGITEVAVPPCSSALVTMHTWLFLMASFSLQPSLRPPLDFTIFLATATRISSNSLSGFLRFPSDGVYDYCISIQDEITKDGTPHIYHPLCTLPSWNPCTSSHRVQHKPLRSQRRGPLRSRYLFLSTLKIQNLLHSPYTTLDDDEGVPIAVAKLLLVREVSLFIWLHFGSRYTLFSLLLGRAVEDVRLAVRIVKTHMQFPPLSSRSFLVLAGSFQLSPHFPRSASTLIHTYLRSITTRIHPFNW